MGILTGYELTKNCGREICVRDLRGKTVAIDMITYALKLAKWRDDVDRRSLFEQWRLAVDEFLRQFTDAGVRVICVFDGRERAAEKRLCMDQRRIKRSTHPHPTHIDVENLMTAINTLGYSVFLAAGEAEAVCCHLLKERYVDEIIGEDRDVIMYGAEHFIMFGKRKLTGGVFDRYSLEEILRVRALSFEQLFCSALAMGVDYNVEYAWRRVSFAKALEHPELLSPEYFKEYNRMKEIFTPSGHYTVYRKTTYKENRPYRPGPPRIADPTVFGIASLCQQVAV